MFTGTITARLDAKGRVFLPSEFRRRLADAEAGLMLRRDIYQPCLVIYPAATWQAEAEKLQKELAAAKNASRGQRKERTEKVRTPRTPISEGTPIEDILGDTDWMVSASSLRPNGDADSRRQNRRKDPPENASQLSLF